MKKKRFLIFLAVGLLASGVAKAEDVTDSTGVKSYFNDEVVVTATKTVNSISDAGGSSITVITEDEIEQSGQQTVEDVIKGTTGIDVVANGGVGGTESSVFIRGADSKYTLLLVDGVPLYDPSAPNRSAVFSHLTVDNIERIEIVRGPVSTLYGNAASGAINVITKKGASKPEVYVGAEGGSYGTWKVYGGARGAQNGFDYSVNVSRFESAGFSVADDDNDRIPHGGNTLEKDGYENTTGSLNLGYQFNDNVRLESIVRYTDSSVELDEDTFMGYIGDRWDATSGPKNKRTDTEQWLGRIALQMDFKPVLSTIYYNFADQRRERYDNAGDADPYGPFYEGNLYEIGLQHDISISENNTVTAGLNYSNETYEDADFATEVGVFSFFAQDQLHIDSFTLVGTIRYDDHEAFGDETTWRVAPSYKFDDTTLKASYGTGFRAPSLYELYGPDIGSPPYVMPVGNPNLKPEKSEGWDVGIEHRFTDRFRGGLTYFRIDYDDRIDYDWVYGYVQLKGITEIQGIETFVEWAASDDVFLSASYTWTDTEDPDGEELERRPRHKASLTGSWDVTEKARLAANMQWVGDRKAYASAKDKDGNPVKELESYFLVNLTGSYKLTDHVELYGRVDNLFDEFYEEAWSYATPGLSAYAGVKLTY